MIAATKVTTAVITAIVHSGSAQRTDQPSWSTSRLVRVSRSPEPADSTTPTGSASALPTKSSRSSASTCSPSTWLVSRAYRVSTVWATRNPASTRMIRSTWPTVVPSFDGLDEVADQPRGGQPGQGRADVQRQRGPQQPGVAAGQAADVAAQRSRVGDRAVRC